MRIALDFDGTIVDAASAKVRYARERCGVELTPATSMRPDAVPLLGEAAYEEMIRLIFGTELGLSMEPMPGAVEAIGRLARDHDLHVVTARYEHEGVFARQWLSERGLDIRSVVVTNRGPKVDHCVALEASVLLEDSPGELARFEEAGVAASRLALLDAPYNVDGAWGGTVRRAEHWHVVPDWPAFEALVEHLATK